ncbi:MAG: signal peptidase II [Betaproteobacteria bacterium]|nr:signal peptidase II [Betaproteobacteria bacterium]MDH5220023.1 signal peptidase II [Betaproteobacteria bacterium]MDH5352306.1 signal peptidase II [Betaproteobacteria bacterium]
MRSAWPWFAAAGAVVAADRLAKWLMLGWLRPGESVEVTSFFNLVLVFNRGAAFSFLAGAPGWQTPFFVAVALVAAGVVSWLLLRHARQRLLCAGLALILGGALGNLWDRLAWGAVADFLDFHAFGWHWPAFNVADSAITVGAALVIVEGFLRKD